ncbi:MAG: NAD(P)/FAD-dependent oxidoreductase [Candidatus Carbobacillus altaicus]|nr:NAD(P)/FAD-dependent oxidoreductase [Candidatus Carbobacillus altaicus]
MAQKIVIVGGGTAGTTVANRLARTLAKEIEAGQVEVHLYGDQSVHLYQPGYLFVALNMGDLDDFTRPQKTLVHSRVHWHEQSIKELDLKHHRLITEHEQVPYDLLVIATGSVPNFHYVPGMAEVTENFYTPDGAVRLRDRLNRFTEGRILIVQDMPHKCPAAPLEITLMLDDYFRKRDFRKSVEIKYTYPIGRIHALQSVADWALPHFIEREIQYETYFNMERVDPERKVVITMDGAEHPFDLLISIPIHQGAEVIRRSGIGDELGFIPTDRTTLKMIDQEDVYVIGDATNLPISKAGSTAHYQAEVLVKNITDRIQGRPETTLYGGKVACFLESSLGEASFITFDYHHPPHPAQESEMLHWFKGMYNELYWLTARGLM